MKIWILVPVLLEAGTVLDISRAPTRATPPTQFLPYVLATGSVIAIVAAYFIVRHVRRREDEPVIGAAASSQGSELDADAKQRLRDAMTRGDYMEAGNLLNDVDRYAEAAENFAKAEAWQYAAEAYHAAGHLSQAIHFFKKAGQRRRAAKLYAERGDNRSAAAEFAESGEEKLAAKYYEKAEDYRRAAAHYALADMNLEAAKNFEKADVPIKAARQYGREFLRMLDDVDGDVDRLGTAVNYAKKAGEFFEEAEKFSKAAEIYRRADLLEDAARSLQKAGKPTRAADLLMKAGRVDGAVNLLQEAGEAKRAHRAQGELAYESGEYDRAAMSFQEAGDFEKAAQLYADALDNPEKAAQMYEEADEWLKAARFYNKAEMYADAGHCAEKGGDLARAAKLYRRSGNIDAEIRVRKSQGDYFRAGRLLFEQRRYDEALETLQRINSRDPIYSKSLELQGDIYRSMEEYEQAYSRYRSALGNRDPSDTTLPLHYKMARILEVEEDWTEAVDHYETILDVDDKFEDAADRFKAIKEGLQKGGGMKGTVNGMDDGNADRSLVVGENGGIGDPNTFEDGGESDVRYEFVEEIARGGMGVVYKARDTFLNRIVAVKLLGEDLRNNETAVKYFLREARAAAALAHPNIVTIFDAGEQKGEYYIAMEYVDGETLKEMIKRGVILSENKVRHILLQSCKALEYAHEQEVIHRDVKSGNIMWKSEDSAVKVMDFGLAKFLREYKQNHTQQVGTPYYMSPEQIIGKNVDFRSDLYGLGCTAFECVTGRVPFTEGELAYHHVHTEPPSPREFNPDISQEMEEIILRLLEKDPDDRYQSARALIDVIS